MWARARAGRPRRCSTPRSSSPSACSPAAGPSIGRWLLRRTTTAAETPSQLEGGPAGTIAVPAPSGWPLVLAFGLVLVFAGLATSAAVSLLGAVAGLAGAVGWFRAVLPREAHAAVPREPQPAPAATARREVVHLHVVRDSRRAWLPIEGY